MRNFATDDNAVLKPGFLEFVNQWESAGFKYSQWLKQEGFTTKQARLIIDAAVERAALDLSKFPVC